MIKVIGPGSETQKLQALLAEQDDGDSDLLVVNALSEHQDTEFEQIDDQFFDQVCIEDIADCFAEIVEVLPDLRKGSRIVFLVFSAFLGELGCATQSTASAMLIGLARSLALELAGQRISVNCFAFKKGCNIDGVDEAIALLLADRAADVNGQVILRDGGENLSLRKS